MSLARHCDGPGCDVWQKSESVTSRLIGWLDVTSPDDGGTWHFCDWDCCMKFSAQFEPPQIIQGPFGGAE